MALTSDPSLFRLAVVEDDATIRTVLELALLGAGYTRVATYGRGDDALEAIRREKPDLVLLDVMLPGLDGFTIAERIRATADLADTRILMLTARTQNEDIVRGLEAGADDYVTKPFDRKVLLARVKALLRRGFDAAADFDGLVLDGEARSARLDGAELSLTAGEYRLLAQLVAHRGRVLGRNASERTVDVQVANLRHKLGRWSEHIETIRGVGYRVM